MINILLDPGHGRESRGAEREALCEAVYAWEFCEDVREIIEETAGVQKLIIKTPLTRTHAENPEKAVRAYKAQELKADLVICVHVNTNPSQALSGKEIYYRNQGDLNFAEVFAKSMMIRKYFETNDTDWKKRAHNVLQRYARPAFLVELGYLSNDRDFKKLQDPLYRARMVLEFCQGILNVVAHLRGEG